MSQKKKITFFFFFKSNVFYFWSLLCSCWGHLTVIHSIRMYSHKCVRYHEMHTLFSLRRRKFFLFTFDLWRKWTKKKKNDFVFGMEFHLVQHNLLSLLLWILLRIVYISSHLEIHLYTFSSELYFSGGIFLYLLFVCPHQSIHKIWNVYFDSHWNSQKSKDDHATTTRKLNALCQIVLFINQQEIHTNTQTQYRSH